MSYLCMYQEKEEEPVSVVRPKKPVGGVSMFGGVNPFAARAPPPPGRGERIGGIYTVGLVFLVRNHLTDV